MDFCFRIRVRQWKDKATGCWMIYSKKYEICAYGETKADAREMFNVVVSEIIKATLPNKKPPVLAN